jgi:hypothetical protein
MEHPPQWAFHFLKCSMNSGRKNTYVRCFPITLEKLVQVYMEQIWDPFLVNFIDSIHISCYRYMCERHML